MAAETIFALSSGRPPAAISVIRISGSRAHEAAALLAGSLPEARTAAVRDLRDPGKGELLDQEGGLRKQVAEWQERLLGLSAEAERAIDYDEADEAVDQALIRDCAELAAELGGWLERPRMEPLKDGVRVVVAGPTNAGKSSLLN